MGDIKQDLTRTTLAVFLIVGLTAASFWILQPFLPAAVWATMIVVATWPLMLRIQARLWNRRALAVIVMTMVLLLVFVVPLSLAIITILRNADRLASWAQSLVPATLPPPPAWLDELPLVGPAASQLWSNFAAMGPENLPSKFAPYTGAVIRWFLAQVGGIGFMFVQILLTVIFAAIMYAGGERWGKSVVGFGRRLAGDRGEASVLLAGHAIRGVALGVVVTAIVQSGLGGVGLAICGVPYPAILTALMFMLCIAQIGPGLVLVPAIIWMYRVDEATWATVLLVWSLIVISLDNFLRPILIKRSSDLPLLLIFVGVIGGLIAFGLIGIFIGPVVLAVAYTLLQTWITDETRPVR